MSNGDETGLRAVAAAFGSTVRRQADAADRAAQIRAWPADRQKKAAALTVRCKAGGAVLRVYRLRDGVLAVPVGTVWVGGGTTRRELPDGWWLRADQPDVLIAGCAKRCRNPHPVRTTHVFETLQRGQKVMPLR